jgi:hypothetical protein
MVAAPALAQLGLPPALLAGPGLGSAAGTVVAGPAELALLYTIIVQTAPCFENSLALLQPLDTNLAVVGDGAAYLRLTAGLLEGLECS